jgi:TonB family protein
MRKPPSGGPSRPSLLRTFVPPVWTKPIPATVASSGAETVAAPGIAVDGIFLAASAIPIGKLFVNTPAPPPPKPVVERPKSSSEPMRVSGGVQMAKLIRKVMPVYPPLAKSARISGVVHLIGTIAKDGTIRNLQIVGGHPMLARAAVEAVEQWVYQPTLLNGVPVEVIAPIEVNFTLSE